MTKDFTVDDWKDLDGVFVLLYTKEVPGKHIIQVFKKDQDGSYVPAGVSVKDKGNNFILSVNRDPFEGYVVLR